ncbi:hypothetical protein FH966_09305 [Lentibacillus cibarius]|uniref:Uncharacterized protein n=1 Tax=Lentibacillus cibarius TaxID=2583219 RepID=A0A549YJ17_9BACI|nr:hypothetical protein [Lentibacillus cibarius]TRM11862.1 hypothetical protein FH966_09305 [Lentibacillus cibarius]
MRCLNDEELQLASRFLFLSMAITVIQQDIQHVQAGTFKIKEPYLDMLEAMNTEATNERKDLRKMMRDKSMRVVTLNKNDSFSSYLFLCNGREEKRNYFNPAIRKKVEIIIKELMHKALPPYQHYSVAHTSADYQEDTDTGPSAAPD